MSRKSVYRAGRAHHTPYGPDVDTSVVYWDFKEVEMQALGEEEPGTGEVKPRPFNVKMWVIEENGQVIDDGDANERVQFKERLVKPLEVEAANENGLSASDIRGAVGGEAIPGISSSSHAQPSNEDNEPKIVELEDTPAESAPASAQPIPAPATEVPTEASTDVQMDTTATEPASTEPQLVEQSSGPVSQPEAVPQPDAQPVETQTVEPEPEPVPEPAQPSEPAEPSEVAQSTELATEPATEQEDIEMGQA